MSQCLAIALALSLTAPPAVERTADPAPADGPAIRVSGTIVTPDGKPVPNAKVVVRAKIGGHQYTFGLLHNRDVLARTNSDTEGRFAFDGIGIPPRLTDVINDLMRGRAGAEIVAWADGWGMVWMDLTSLAPMEPFRLALTPEVNVYGTVVDAEGKAVKDVRVTIGGFTKSMTDSRGSSDLPGDLNLSLSELQLKTATNLDGQFTIPHLPADYRISTIIEHAGSKRKVVYVNTGSNAELKKLQSRRDAFEVQRSPLKITLEPQRSATVKVVDHTGKIVTDGGVEMIDSQRRFAGWQAVDERGEVHMPLKEPGKYSVSYGSDPLSPRLGQNVTVDIPAGDNSPTFEIRLPDPAWLTGQVVNSDTGKGIVGAYLYYSQSKGAAADGPHGSAMCVSGADGKFRMPVVRGEGQVIVTRQPYTYFVLESPRDPAEEQRVPKATIETLSNGELASITLRLTRGLAIRGRVLSTDGRPVSGAIVEGSNQDRSARKSTAVSNSDGQYELLGLSPNDRAILTVRSSAGVRRTAVEGVPDHPWEKTLWKDLDLRLEPGVAIVGRALLKGQPRPGVTLRLFRTTEKGGNRYALYAETKTDAAGQYRFNGLAADDGFTLEIRDPDNMGDPNWDFAVRGLRIIPGGQPEYRLSDLNLITYGQTLSGVVVDPKGKPVAEITVAVRFLNGQGLSRPPVGPPPWTKSDKDGRFELTQLPDQPLELMSYRANPQGGRIVHPSIIKPAQGQKNIRIVFDPSLTDDVDDIDKPKPPAERKDP